MSASPVVGTREIVYRIFAAELDDASLSYPESDEERTSNYMVTPTDTRLDRTFVAGMLAEVEHVSDKVLRGHITDPTGAFVTYTGQYQPGSMAYLDAATPPAFVSLVDKARTCESDDADVVCSSIRPENVNTVGADVHNRWIVSATEVTLRHIVVFDEALSMPYRGGGLIRTLETRDVDSTLAAGVPRAINHYGTTRTYLEALCEVAVQVLGLIAGGHDQVDPLDVAPGNGGDAVLDPFPKPDLEPATGVNIEVGEADADEVETDAGKFEDESGSEPAATLDSRSEFDGGAESKAVEPRSESEPIAEPDSEPGSTSDPESVAARTTVAAEGQPGVSESEPVSEPSTTVDLEPEPKPTTEPESEPVAGPDLTSEPEPEPVAGPLDAESELDFNDGTFGDSEDDAPGTGATDVGSLDDSGSRTLDDFDDGFSDPDPEAGDSTGSTDSASADADDSVDPDGMYELDGDERAGIRSEFDTEFTPGADVNPADETDIDVPDVDDLTEQLEDESAATAESDPKPATTATEPEPAVDSEPEPTPDATSNGDEDGADADPDADESAEDIDLKSVAVDAMGNLDDGDDATRGEVVAVVVDEHGADPGAVKDAIQEALLGGRCYEPQGDVLKTI